MTDNSNKIETGTGKKKEKPVISEEAKRVKSRPKTKHPTLLINTMN